LAGRNHRFRRDMDGLRIDRMEEEEASFNDFNFWRMGPPPLERPASPSGLERQDEEERRATREASSECSSLDPERDFNQFAFWRLAPPTLDIVRMNSAETPSALPPPVQAGMAPSDVLASPSLRGQSAAHSAQETEEGAPETENEWLEVEGDGEESDWPASAQLELLGGSAGTRLLGLLGQLTQHLGSSSRFARAAGLLQEDMLRQREQIQETSRIEPPEGSTLQRPEISRSVGSLLHILQSPDSPIGAPREVVTAPPPLVFDPSAAMPPPSPASPESVATLSPPCSKFMLSAPASCPICLEAIEDVEAALQMPCARSHVFHKECLLCWLGERNTCPVCRHHLPEAEAAEDQAAPQQLSVRIRGLEASGTEVEMAEDEMAEAEMAEADSL